MTIGLLQLEIFLPNTHSLKDKRSVLKRMKNLLRKQFNISVSEIGNQDQWGKSLLGILTISNSSSVVSNTLGKVEKFIESNFEVHIIGSRLENL